MLRLVQCKYKKKIMRETSKVSFIRAKEISPRSGNWYDYEVKTVHENGKVIQRHIRYIGKSVLRASFPIHPRIGKYFPTLP
jgi:hypothetical protein